MHRKYEKVIKLLPIVKGLTSQGKTQPQIADELGLSDKKVVWNLLYRERQKEVQGVPRFIHFYNNERIQLKTKLTPLEKRNQFVARFFNILL